MGDVPLAVTLNYSKTIFRPQFELSTVKVARGIWKYSSLEVAARALRSRQSAASTPGSNFTHGHKGWAWMFDVAFVSQTITLDTRCLQSLRHVRDISLPAVELRPWPMAAVGVSHRLRDKSTMPSRHPSLIPPPLTFNIQQSRVSFTASIFLVPRNFA